MEIRVYYECYEQATNFIPLKSISEEHSIKYIQKKVKEEIKMVSSQRNTQTTSIMY